jgi:hypothetical protein
VQHCQDQLLIIPQPKWTVAAPGLRLGLEAWFVYLKITFETASLINLPVDYFQPCSVLNPKTAFKDTIV